MVELGKFDFKINVIPNRLEKYISFSLDNKLLLIDNFQFLSSFLDSFIKNVDENHFKHLSQQFAREVLDFVKQNLYL